MKKLIFIVMTSFLLSVTQGQNNLPRFGKNSNKEVVAAMTLEEKALLVVGMGFKLTGVSPAEKKADTKTEDTAKSKEGFTLPPVDPADMAIPERVPGAAGRTHAIPRLGIPSITVSDGPAGVRIEPFRNGDSSVSYYATAWPVATLLASSWDTALVEKLGAAFGAEIRDYGVDIILGPGMNIHRNPLGGRNFEYYSEDPVIAGKMTASIVRGIQQNGVGTSIKHFAANNQETNRNQINTIVSERALREIYLRGFQIAIQESQPWTVMSSYNKINGIYSSQRSDLLTTVLRDEWGFKGFVMSDWYGGKDPVEQMKAGNDLLMPGGATQSKAIVDAVNAGKLDVGLLDRNVEKILNILMISPTFKNVQYSNKPDLVKHAGIVRTTAAEGMILLKNEQALPLPAGKKIALFGNSSYTLIAGGSGSGDVNKAYTVSLAEGLINAGYRVDKSFTDAYSSYIKAEKIKQPKPKFFFLLPPPILEMDLSPATIEQQASLADYALYTIGRNAGEGNDRKVENDFNLPDQEKVTIREISKAFHEKGKKLVVVLNIGGVIEMQSWKDLADGILLAWQPGLEGGNSIADVLSGKVNPSGKLATSFPMQYQDVPSAKNFPGRELDPSATAGSPLLGKASEVIYEEGIYVGYRYYKTFKVKTAYPFGYGLSYTKFDYSDLSFSNASFNGRLTVSVKVTNSGKQAGKEVVQLYLSAPSKNLDKPAEELKGFGKTGLLSPGQSQTLQFILDPMSLASFDTGASAWVAESGKYTVGIGASSEDIRLTKDFSLDTTWKGPKLHKVMAPESPVNELKP